MDIEKYINDLIDIYNNEIKYGYIRLSSFGFKNNKHNFEYLEVKSSFCDDIYTDKELYEIIKYIYDKYVIKSAYQFTICLEFEKMLNFHSYKYQKSKTLIIK